MNEITSRVGLLFRDSDPATRGFLGSCFCIETPTVFLTAAHCIKDVSLDRLWVNHHGGPTPSLFSKVHRVEIVNDADIAILVTDAPGAKWVQPFRQVRLFANLGEHVCAFGYPDTAVCVDSPSKETPRFFRGTVQRPFIHKSKHALGSGYSAYELSFPCPHGLSGGPLFPEEDPQTVIAVVTEDLEVGSELHYEERIDEATGSKTVLQTRRVINYGVAANILAATDALEAIIGAKLRIHHAV